MHITPNKNDSIQFNSLRQQITNKISTNKKERDLEKSKSPIKLFNKKIKESNKYASNSSIKKSFNFQQKRTLFHNQPLFYENHFQDNIQERNQDQITQQKILQFQSLQHRGFYGYQEWKQLNKKYFTSVSQQTVHTLWKIIRIINYGQILIPSGLVFQITNTLYQQRSVNLESNYFLRKVLNSFLKMNNVSDQVQNFRQLKNYPSIQQIQNKYTFRNNKPSCKITERKHSYSTSKLNCKGNSKHVFDRIYQDANIRNQRKNSSIYKNLIAQKLQEQCIFHPKINTYDHSQLFQDSVQRPERICHDKQKWKTSNQNNDILILQKNFRTSKFDKSIFQNSSLEDIPGVTEHINRKKYSQVAKQRIQRYFQKPISVFKHF